MNTNYSNETLHIYCRESGKLKASLCSVEKQLEKGIEHARKMGFKNYKIWYEDIKSENLCFIDRPNIYNLLLNIECGFVKHVFVSDWNILSTEKYFAETFRCIFNECGINLWMTNNRPIDLSKSKDNTLNGFIIHNCIGNYKQKTFIYDLLKIKDSNNSRISNFRVLTFEDDEHYGYEALEIILLNSNELDEFERDKVVDKIVEEMDFNRNIIRISTSHKLYMAFKNIIEEEEIQKIVSEHRENHHNTIEFIIPMKPIDNQSGAGKQDLIPSPKVFTLDDMMNY